MSRLTPFRSARVVPPFIDTNSSIVIMKRRNLAMAEWTNAIRSIVSENFTQTLKRDESSSPMTFRLGIEKITECCETSILGTEKCHRRESVPMTIRLVVFDV